MRTADLVPALSSEAQAQVDTSHLYNVFELNYREGLQGQLLRPDRRHGRLCTPSTADAALPEDVR